MESMGEGEVVEFIRIDLGVICKSERYVHGEEGADGSVRDCS